MIDPLVSVIVPLYNYQNYITWCMESILNQDYKNLELIVVDDRSVDKSYKVVSEFAKNKPQIKIVRMEVNSGYSKAKNEGIVVSQGEFIVTLDADDMMTKNSVVPRLRCLQETGADFVHARALNVGAASSLEKAYAMTKRRRPRVKIHAQSVMLRRDVHKNFGLYDENLRSRSDKEMWWRLFGQGLAGVQRIKREFILDDVAFYRIHPKSMMVSRRRNSGYNKKVTKLLYRAYKKRLNEGITLENTRFLET